MKNLAPLFLFLFILSVYSASSVGLINSGDTTQYFTTESIIKHKSIDLSFFRNDPHFFVYPDVLYENNKILNIRGYLQSIFCIPLHLIARLYENQITSLNFPKEVSSPNLNYEIAVVSQFPLFSVFGLFVLWVFLKDVLKSKSIAYLSILCLAFGSYFWKYSSYYARQGFSVSALSLSLYCLAKYLKHPNKYKPLLIMFVIVGITFGIDLIMFFSLLIAALLTAFLMFILKMISFNQLKKNLINSLFAITIIVFIIAGMNFYLYGNFVTFSVGQFQKWYVFNNLLKDESLKLLTSTPLFPTFFYVLFGLTQLPQSIFNSFTKYPDIANALSINFATKYDFYGLISISPFLMIGIGSIYFWLKKELNKSEKILLFFSLSTFLLGTSATTKSFNFFAPNQYDTRYFYPYILLLIYPMSLSIKKLMLKKSKLIKLSLVLGLLLSGTYSILMGWLGVLNMYKPALTGERKIWISLRNLNSIFQLNREELLNATFMNRENFIFPVIVFLIIFILVKILLSLFTALKEKFPHISSLCLRN